MLLSALFASHAHKQTLNVLLKALQLSIEIPIRSSRATLILALLKPWVATIDLSADPEKKVPVVHCLLALTQEYGISFPLSLIKM